MKKSGDTHSYIVISQACRWLCYLSWSYVWLGAMALLMIHQVTPYLWGGGLLALFFFWGAKRLDPQAFANRGKPLARTLVIGGFILFQFLSWRFFYFFRDPERKVPEGNVIVSPADGFVVYIREVKEGQAPLAIKEERPIPLKEILSIDPGSRWQEAYHIGIFMTPMSVHVNRSPIAGTVIARAYTPGSEMKSMLPMSLRTMFHLKPFEKGSEHILTNERETLLIEGDFPVYITRIADPYVDKIVTWKTTGESVASGEKIGLIKMGSQTDIVFPRFFQKQPLKIQVKEGQYVYAGSTVLATYGTGTSNP